MCLDDVLSSLQLRKYKGVIRSFLKYEHPKIDKIPPNPNYPPNFYASKAPNRLLKTLDLNFRTGEIYNNIVDLYY